MDTYIRIIQHSDNISLATIVRNTLAEFGANRPGTVYFDPSTDNLFDVFQAPRSMYYVASTEDKLLGGAGIYPSEGLPPDVCELVKMYLLPEARGKGTGRLLIEKCMEFARDAGYRRVYLESLPELKKAIHLYEQFNFTHLTSPMGNTGHFGCDVWMIKELF